MAQVSYEKLWNKLKENNMQKTDLYRKVNQKNRYDVTVLVNGLPLVHIELKKRGIAIREAFNQIERYQRDSFWSGHGLYEYVQIFIISNGTHTKYYSNTTRFNHVEGSLDELLELNLSKLLGSVHFDLFFSMVFISCCSRHIHGSIRSRVFPQVGLTSY